MKAEIILLTRKLFPAFSTCSVISVVKVISIIFGFWFFYGEGTL